MLNMLGSVGEQLVGNTCSVRGMTWARRRGTLGMLDFFHQELCVFFVVKISDMSATFDSKDEQVFFYSRDVVLSLHRSCCR